MKSHRELLPPRLRILALHGRGSNSDVTRMQLLNLGLSEAEYDIVYANGPIPEGKPGPGIEALAGLVSGPWYSWIEDSIDANSLLAAVEHVRGIVEQQGPFDAVFGFSQACLVASLVNGLAQDEALQVALRSRKGPFHAAADANRKPLGVAFPLAIFACAAAPSSLQQLRTQAGLGPAPTSAHDYESIHLIGRHDDHKAWSESFALAMNSSRTRVLYLAGGHEISQLQGADQALGMAIRQSLQQARSAPPADEPAQRPDVWRPSSQRSSRAVDPAAQIVAVHTRTEDLPDTILGMLAAQPYSAPLLRLARERDPRVCTSYGQMLAFCSAGGEGDLRRIGVQAGEVVAYLAPAGGSATAATAFLSIASQTVAAPFSSGMTASDALTALEQYGVKHMILFEGVQAPGVR